MILINPNYPFKTPKSNSDENKLTDGGGDRPATPVFYEVKLLIWSLVDLEGATFGLVSCWKRLSEVKVNL